MNEDIINKFKERLDFFHKENKITKLYRGEAKEYIEDNLHCYNVRQISEKLFFYGSKAKYFWGDRDFHIGINQVDDETFRYIFRCFFNIINYGDHNDCERDYFEINKETVDIFLSMENENNFLNEIRNIDENQKILLRNHYFTILHQIGERKCEKEYKKNSFLISLSKEFCVADEFKDTDGNGGIIINCWNINQEKSLPSKLRIFKGELYPQEKEETLFGGIFPHFIYSFCYDGEEYFNPALELLPEEMIDITIEITGFDIDQDKFYERMKKETSLNKALSKYNDRYSIIKN